MRRQYVGAAQAARLSTSLGGSTTNLTITCNDLTNWPTGASGRPFFVVVNRNTVSEEKILCASRSGNVITVYDDGLLNGRGADGTQIASHASNSVIEHVFTATDADEANALVNLLTTKGDLLVYGTANDRFPVGANGAILVADSNETLGVKWGTPDLSSYNIINPFLLMGA